ncbi:MAG: radical SAM protein [Armatimonadota bacterium]
MTRANTREQYLAGETGTIRKDPGGKLRVALLYPNTYEVGMSNLGFHTLYRLLNARTDVVCERAFLPINAPTASTLRTLESDTPLGEMDLIAFSISFELDYPHIPRMLRLGGIEPFAEQRAGPIVLAGGATVNYNPEPIAPFLDAAFIGEAEEMIDPLVNAAWEARGSGAMSPFAALPGVYIPAHGMTPTARILVRDLNGIPIYNHLFSEQTEFGALALMEIGRGCPYGCRFCVASHVYRPARWRSVAALLPVVDRGLQYRKRIGLLGASVTDHPDILTLCDAVLARGGQLSLASMRAGALTPELLGLLARGNVQTITLAPETGTERLRRAVGKRLTDEALFTAAGRAKQAGITGVKLYFIVGLPGETEEDVAAIPALVLRLARETHMKISLGCSVFVPKPGTPFARRSMIPEREARRKIDAIRRALRGQAQLTEESPRWSYWQAVLARGGRELAAPLAAIAQGAETPVQWAAVFRDFGIDADALALREIAAEAPLPWEHIGRQRCAFTDFTGGDESNSAKMV